MVLTLVAHVFMLPATNNGTPGKTDTEKFPDFPNLSNSTWNFASLSLFGLNSERWRVLANIANLWARVPPDVLIINYFLFSYYFITIQEVSKCDIQTRTQTLGKDGQQRQIPGLKIAQREIIDNAMSTEQMTVIYNEVLHKNEINCLCGLFSSPQYNDGVISLTPALMEKPQSRN